MNIIKRVFLRILSRGALPYWCILMVDCLIVFVSGLAVYYLQFGSQMLIDHFYHVSVGLIVSLLVFLISFFAFHTYRGILRYSSFVDLNRLAYSVGTSCAIVCLLHQMQVHDTFVPDLYFPRFKGAVLIFILATSTMWALRVFVKTFHDSLRNIVHAKKVFIYGCQTGGIALAKSVLNSVDETYRIAGFVSDDPTFEGTRLLGIPVYYDNENLVQHMIEKKVSVLFVSPIQSLQFTNRSSLIDRLLAARIKIMMIPQAQEWDGKSELTHQLLREVEIEDLLPRDKIEIDMEAIGKMLRGKCILITGAAGSIGSEIARQVALFRPSHLILTDQAETPMHDVRLFMAQSHRDLHVETIVTSICNQEHMEKIFAQYRPEYVFHAAAYKHVPMMEDNPAEAVQNNIYGTRVIADLAVKFGTKKFVMVSTDKAVNPTNVMGCSKRICEIYCQALNAEVQAVQNGSSEQCSGSIVGSNGSNGSSGTSGSSGSNGSKGLNGSQSIEQIELTKSLNQTIRQNGIIRRFSNISESKGTLEAGLSDYQTGGVQVRQSLCPADSSISGICDGQHSGGVRETREQGVQELPVHSQGLLRRTEESSDESSRCELHNGRDLQSDVCGLQEAVNRDSQLHQDNQGFGIQGDKVPVGLEPSEAIEPLEPSEAIEPLEPSEAIEPLEPSEAIEPLELSEAIEPLELSEAIEPLEPSEAIEPLEPFEPNKLRQFDGSLPVTQFVTTRFGNVLGSNGSVIPIFKEQIRKGGPVTVTHPDIIRYFMLIPEACRLVLQAGTMGHGGEIYVFDMGKPVRIADLAQRMIDLSGAKNIKILYTGLREGEKLYEELLASKENTIPTPHPNIMVAQVPEYPYEQALQNEIELYRISKSFDDMAIVKKMKEIVPEFKSNNSKYEILDEK